MEPVRKFLESSSIGGLSFIITSNTKAEKMFWLAVVIFSISATTYLTAEAIDDWSKYPVATTIESFPISEVPFPNITVCPPKAGFSFTYTGNMLILPTSLPVSSSVQVQLRTENSQILIV